MNGLDDAFVAFGFTPEAVNVDHVLARARNWDFEKSLLFRCFEEDSLLLSQSMADFAAADPSPCWQAAAEFLDVVLIRPRHDGDLVEPVERRKAGRDFLENAERFGFVLLGGCVSAASRYEAAR